MPPTIHFLIKAVKRYGKQLDFATDVQSFFKNTLPYRCNNPPIYVQESILNNRPPPVFFSWQKPQIWTATPIKQETLRDSEWYLYKDLTLKFKNDVLLKIHEDRVLIRVIYNGNTCSLGTFTFVDMLGPDALCECMGDCVEVRDKLIRRLSVDIITNTYISWKWKKDHLYNPHDPIGKKWLQRRAERDCRDIYYSR